jgi:hypothetical protein
MFLNKTTSSHEDEQNNKSKNMKFQHFLHLYCSVFIVTNLVLVPLVKFAYSVIKINLINA